MKEDMQRGAGLGRRPAEFRAVYGENGGPGRDRDGGLPVR